tara:strand:- start:143 stop:454 length:312 start_codon:yes stop_codon:yes gene_type:complete
MKRLLLPLLALSFIPFEFINTKPTFASGCQDFAYPIEGLELCWNSFDGSYYLRQAPTQRNPNVGWMFDGNCYTGKVKLSEFSDISYENAVGWHNEVCKLPAWK